MPDDIERDLGVRGFAFTRLRQAAEHVPDDVPHAHWLGVPQSVDAFETRAVLSATQPTWVVVDHYSLDARWELAVRDQGARILAIDDIADRDHACDLLLDQNLYDDMSMRYDARVPQECTRLLGPGYALVRGDFRRVRNEGRPRDGQIRRLLVMLSGTDPHNHTEKVLRALCEDLIDLDVDVVIGSAHPARSAIERLCSEHEFSLHVATDHVAALMRDADLAVGGTGVASWERCCLGLPAIGLTLADNQVAIADKLGREGVIVNLGDATRVRPAALRAALSSLRNDRQRMQAMSAAGMALVDGRGADRVRDQMLEAA
jgi:UDP-2,4-diacetamido-2,4,6-trideoxy-beta-L-altropyranose hydrolase